REAAEEFWVRSWERALDEIREGIQASEDQFTKDLAAWRETSGDMGARATTLDALLRRYFHPEKQTKKQPSALEAGLDDLRQENTDETLRKIISGKTDEELRSFVQEELENIIGDPSDRWESFERKILELRYLSESPKNYREIGEDVEIFGNHKVSRSG